MEDVGSRGPNVALFKQITRYCLNDHTINMKRHL